MDRPYGNDSGYRIQYTKLTHTALEFKATSMVNADADEGLDVDELKRHCRLG